LVTLSFPIYPLLRLVRIGPLRSLTRVWYSLAGIALLVVLVWAGYRLDELWEFEDWRGMMKSGQFPATRVAVSLLGAYLDPTMRYGLTTGLDWPRGERPLTNAETQELQRRLTALGYPTQGIDGIVGPNTRDAIRAFQSSNGITPDGYL